jgi:hypothetical protein
MKKIWEDLLVEQCSPTLAGIKPGSLFRYEGDSAEHLVCQWDKQLRPLGIRVTILKRCQRTGASMVYVYRERWLSRILRGRPVAAFLAGYGYPNSGVAAMLGTLSRRYCVEREMPHEIGVFLGYPLEDVVGFIENKGQNFTCCGCWKSYGDPTVAQRWFDRYRACTSSYQQQYYSGTPIIQLVVAA